MELPKPKNPSSARTARTYPVTAKDLAHAVEEAVRGLPGWTVTRATEDEVRATRETRFLSFTDDITVRLTQSRSGANTNTRAEFTSASRTGAWDLGQNRRNLGELLAAIDRKLAS